MIRRSKWPARSTKPIARRTSLRSSTPVHRRKLAPRRSERMRDPEYMQRVRELPCCARDLSSCNGPIEADHAGRRPLGRKADDRTCIPLCKLHHRQRTDWSGVFRPWPGDYLRAWLDARILDTQRALDLASSHEGFPW